jgi:hypothetical protein
MTAQVFGPTTIPDLLGRKLEDARSLSLTAAQAHVISQESPGGTEYTLVLGAALGRRALMDLLYTLAPYKAHGPDRFARVLDNWGLHDRAKSSSASEHLFREHARSLKFSWHEFARHRHVFMEVLQDEAGDRYVMPVVSWSSQADGRRRWCFEAPDDATRRAIAKLVEVDLGRAEPNPLVGLVTVPYFVPELRETWRAWQPLVKGGKSNYVGPASVPVVALMHRRAILNSVLVKRVEEYAGRMSLGARQG